MPETVLLVNDDLFFSARIQSLLKGMGFQVETAVMLEQALDRAVNTRPTLVIINLGAPRLDGLELAKRLKAEENPPRILAFMSHVKIPAVRDAARAAGIDLLCANSAITMRLPDLVRSVMRSELKQEDQGDVGS